MGSTRPARPSRRRPRHPRRRGAPRSPIRARWPRPESTPTPYSARVQQPAHPGASRGTSADCCMLAELGGRWGASESARRWHARGQGGASCGAAGRASAPGSALGGPPGHAPCIARSSRWRIRREDPAASTGPEESRSCDLIVTKTGRNGPGHDETQQTRAATSTEARKGAGQQGRRAGTALGLLITQRSQVQILPPLLVSASQGPFSMGEGLWRIRACDHDGGWCSPAGGTGWDRARHCGTRLNALQAISGCLARKYCRASRPWWPKPERALTPG